jgi:hypothetical protein
VGVGSLFTALRLGTRQYETDFELVSSCIVLFSTEFEKLET